MNDLKPNVYLISRWDPSTEKEFITHETLDSVAINPAGINLALFALTVINVMRNAKGLEPVKEEVGRLFYYEKSE